MLKIETNASEILNLTASRGIVAFKGQKSTTSDYHPVLVVNQTEGWYYLINYSFYNFGGLPVDYVFSVDGVKKGLKELETELNENGLYKVDLWWLDQKFSGYDVREEVKDFAHWAENHTIKGGVFAAFRYWTSGMASPCFSDFWLDDQSKEAANLCKDWQDFKPPFSSSCRWQWLEYNAEDEPFSASQQFMIWACWQLVLATGKHENIF